MVVRRNADDGVGCGCFLFVLAFNLALGGFSFDYCLWYIFGKNIPFIADMVCGLFLAELTVPAMFVCWILNLCGIPAPLIG